MLHYGQQFSECSCFDEFLHSHSSLLEPALITEFKVSLLKTHYEIQLISKKVQCITVIKLLHNYIVWPSELRSELAY